MDNDRMLALARAELLQALDLVKAIVMQALRPR